MLPYSRWITVIVLSVSSLPLFAQGMVRAQTDAGSEKIAFASDRTGSSNIYVMDADGSNQTSLTGVAQNENEPQWSPDGTTVAFTRNLAEDQGNGTEWNLFSVGLDGSRAKALTTGQSFAIHPRWSPDGTQIAYSTPGDYGAEERTYLASADASPQVPLIVDVAGIDATNYKAIWSRDGSQIYFVGDRNDQLDLFVRNRDGSNEQPITNSLGYKDEPILSPDGQTILFEAHSPDFNDDWELWTIKVDGSNLKQLTDNNTNDDAAVWSPDSRKIAFVAGRDGNNEIYVMNADGSNQVNLTNSAAADTAPAWSPDGQQIAFVTDRDGNFEIYAMNADGSDPVNLTNNPASDFAPVWQPLPGAVVPVATESPVAPVTTPEVAAATEMPVETEVATSEATAEIPVTVESTTEATEPAATEVPVAETPEALSPTVTEAPTEIPVATADVLVTAEATAEAPVTCTVVARNPANVRKGPGVQFERIGWLAGGQLVRVEAQTMGSSNFVWYRVTIDAGTGWVRADLVIAGDDCANVPFVTP